VYFPARSASLTSFVVLASLLAAACSRKESPPPAPPAPVTAGEPAAETAHALPAGIDWFHGDVDAAFAAAREQSKPLFLYWGAEWCPPCAQIKATIFNRREFQERSRLFIPVYLDGDTPSAQKQGERFGVIGYPTMILFRPDGTEITRLPGGVDVERYGTILDVALSDARPVAEIVTAAVSGAELSANDWRLLAYYSWGSDAGRVIAEEAGADTLRKLSDRCPAELRPECARLFFEYLAVVDQKSMNGLERASNRKQLLDLLDEPAVQSANVSMLLYVRTPALGRELARTARAGRGMGLGAGCARGQRGRRRSPLGSGTAQPVARPGRAAETRRAGRTPPGEPARQRPRDHRRSRPRNQRRAGTADGDQRRSSPAVGCRTGG